MNSIVTHYIVTAILSEFFFTEMCLKLWDVKNLMLINFSSPNLNLNRTNLKYFHQKVP
jgi:hypothetical protein